MKKSPYIAFTTLGYRLLNILTTVLFVVIGFLADVYIGSIGVVILSAGVPLVLVFLDYFAFSGASTRKQKSMSFIKSSCKGFEFFKSTVKTDLIIKHICLLFCYIGFVLAEIIYYTDSEALINSLMLLLIYMPISALTMNITLIISRRISLSMVIQTTVCYICSMISTILLLIYSAIIPENMDDFMLPVIISFFVLGTISIVLAYVLYKDCLKGYTSSFVDT